jgi:hypothetical protein
MLCTATSSGPMSQHPNPSCSSDVKCDGSRSAPVYAFTITWWRPVVARTVDLSNVDRLTIREGDVCTCHPVSRAGGTSIGSCGAEGALREPRQRRSARATAAILAAPRGRWCVTPAQAMRRGATSRASGGQGSRPLRARVETKTLRATGGPRERRVRWVSRSPTDRSDVRDVPVHGRLDLVDPILTVEEAESFRSRAASRRLPRSTPC